MEKFLIDFLEPKGLGQKGIGVLFAVTLLTAGLGKFQSFETPAWFLEQFRSTPLNAFPGAMDFEFFAIAVTETGIGLCALAGLVIKRHRPILLRGTLFSSVLLFSALSFGQRLTFKFDESAQLFLYSATSLALLFLLNQEGKR